MKPKRFFNVKSDRSPIQRSDPGSPLKKRFHLPAVPGLAAKLSAAPPITIVIADPGPLDNMFVHDFLLTEHTPKYSSTSR